MTAPFAEQVAAVLGAALQHGSEEALMASADLGRALVDREIAPEEAIAAWSAALQREAETRGLAPAALRRGCTSLVELVMAYSLAFREQLAERRDEEQRPLRAIAEQSVDGVLVCCRQGLVRWVNPAMRGLMAHTGLPEPGLQQPLCAWALAQPGLPLGRAIDAVLSEGTAWRQELHHGGHSLDASVNAIRDRFGLVTGAALFLRDVSQLRALERAARERERLESLGTLAAGIAHDFNNLIGALLGFADLGLATVGDAETTRTTFGEMRTVGLRARSLVQQITAFAAGQQSPPVPVDLRALVQESARFFDTYRPAGVEVALQLPTVAARVMAQPHGLQQVLLNLLNNACHAVQWRSGQLGVSLEAQAASDGRAGWRLSVSDNGCGMSADVVARVFDPFFTTREVGQGSGLGLSMAYGIVTRLGGTVAVTSAPDQGSRFDLWLPALPQCVSPEELSHAA